MENSLLLMKDLLFMIQICISVCTVECKQKFTTYFSNIFGDPDGFVISALVNSYRNTKIVNNPLATKHHHENLENKIIGEKEVMKEVEKGGREVEKEGEKGGKEVEIEGEKDVEPVRSSDRKDGSGKRICNFFFKVYVYVYIYTVNMYKILRSDIYVCIHTYIHTYICIFI
jgi:hypothetical protein